MLNESIIEDKLLKMDKRLTRVEVSGNYVQDELKEIKRTLRWVIGIIFSLNSTIIGLVAKGFNII